MMRFFYLLLGCLAWALAPAAAQAPAIDASLSLEHPDPRTHLPAGWLGTGSGAYQILADSSQHHDGRYSLRIAARPAQEATTASDFGAASVAVPVTFRGQQVTLSGYLKTENVTEGFAGLWLRVDGDGATLQFDNMSKQQLLGTHPWQQYTITLPLAPTATNLVVGGLLVGKGTIWLDQLTLSVDGQPLAQAPPRPLTGAERDTTFRRGSGLVLAGPPGRQQVANLATLGRVWGFVKYYHPALARGDYNADAELLRLLPLVLASANGPACAQVLRTWLARLGPVPACPTCREPAPDSLRLAADLAWLGDTRQLGPELSRELQYLRHNRAQGPHYYVRAAPGVGNPLFLHEEAYASQAQPHAGLRLLALFRYWNMIEYYFPYRYAIGEDWQRVLPEFVPQVLAAGTAQSYQLAMLRLVARIHDTHARVQGAALTAYWGSYNAPVWVRFVQGRPVVGGYFNAQSGAAQGLQTGDEILAVDGVKVGRLIKQRRPLTPASNGPTQLRNIGRDLLRGPSPQVVLQVRRQGQALTLTVPRYPLAQLHTGLSLGTPDPKAPGWRLLPEGIGYLNLGTLHTGDLPAAFAAARQARGLVIDLRNYPAEFILFALSKYLVAQPTPFVKFSALLPGYPGMFLRQPALAVQPGQPPYPHKVVVLVNEITQSQAEYTTMALRAASQVTVFGSTTAGADGNVSNIVLPGNLTTRISGIGVYYPDGRETQRIGIVPDVVAEPTIEGIRTGRDELLEQAIKLIG